MPPLVDSAQLFPQPLRVFYEPVKRFAESALALDDINAMYERCRGGAAEIFAAKCLRDMGYEWSLPELELAHLRGHQGPIMVVANHPLGGADALLMLILLSRIRPDYRVMANFIIGRVPEVRDRLISVDPFEGRASASRNLGPLREGMRWLKAGGIMGVFPAGEVSSFRFDEGRVADKGWQIQVAKMALKSEAAILPVFFKGGHPAWFHAAGLLHPRLRTLLLPRVLARARRKSLSIVLGPLLPSIDILGRDPLSLSDSLRSHVYSLSDN